MICQICKKQKKPSEVIPAELVSQPVSDTIKKTYPDWINDGYICLSDLNHFRALHVKNVLETEKGELSNLENQVMKSLEEHEILSKNINEEFDQKLTFGEKLADKMAVGAGSWRFIIGFAIILIIWIVLNSVILLWKPFDPYPFILLNLVLSCVAAIQAPIILMSQNREEAKDQLRSEHDYRVNLKAELEIRHLHEKMDHLLMNQWQRLLEIQEIQIDLMEELAGKKTS
ncbi:MAG: hypothetical protein BV457_00300 [Thermoplasmata archaeon M9B1D]|nr:MAG: hypothetical protein BV457_00300 [Thermoplasmata archaeon M9B1D]PNX52185.1 MAG: hypothetical protein BV456_00350 [Thermoplasmata archaeon M8B2D]